jgi:hypothetical protein
VSAYFSAAISIIFQIVFPEKLHAPTIGRPLLFQHSQFCHEDFSPVWQRG